jgi:hypothetical protein
LKLLVETTVKIICAMPMTIVFAATNLLATGISTEAAATACQNQTSSSSNTDLDKLAMYSLHYHLWMSWQNAIAIINKSP